MALLTDLPEEILIMIVKQLDISSIYHLYKSCKHMAAVISLYGVIKVCDFSLNTMATVRSLRLDMFRDIAHHLQELNLCGVPDLTKSALLLEVKKMKSLTTLNVAYTKITILDFLEIYKCCPTIKNVVVNFEFGKFDELGVPDEILNQCQEVFKHLDDIHFVLRILSSNIPLNVLKDCSLNILRYTICNWKGAAVESETYNHTFKFNHMAMFILNWEQANVYQGYWTQIPFLAMLQFDKIEYIVIQYNNNMYSVSTSPLFITLFVESFNITSFFTLNIHRPLHGNVAILVWNKDTTVFDDLFFVDLKKKLNMLLAHELREADQQLRHTYDWYHIYPIPPVPPNRPEVNEPEFKKRRIAPSSLVLNYDALFKDVNNIRLSLFFKSFHYPVTLSTGSEYLRKITYFSLNGEVHCSNEFFNILFRCCENLITLNVEAPNISPCCSPILRSIPLSQSIKNVRLVDRRIDFHMLFSSFSQCATLENVRIHDYAHHFNTLADPTPMFRKCKNLYSLYIRASMSERSSIKKLRMLNNAKNLCHKYHLNVELYNVYDGPNIGYDPFVHVFNLKPIKPV